MPFTRTIAAPIPPAADGRQWIATALLEAPNVDGRPGKFEAIEATTGAVSELATNHAQHEDGWYRLQWYNDGQVSKFSDPVQADGSSAAATVGGLKVTR